MTKTSVPKLHSIKWKDGITAPNMHRLYPRTYETDYSVDDVLREAWMENLQEIALIGYDKYGNEYIASSIGDNRINSCMFYRAFSRCVND